MATKVFTSDVRVGMFVADLDRPWVDTPFLLQGFLVEDEEQIAALRAHCDFVMVDRARSVGAEYEAPPVGARTVPPSGSRVVAPAAGVSAPAKAPGAVPPPVDDDRVETRTVSANGSVARGAPGRPVKLEDIARGAPDVEGSGFFGRLRGFLGRRGEKPRSQAAAVAVAPEPAPETPQEFEARAALLPPGIEVQTYTNQSSVEEEAPRAREVVGHATDLLDKLVSDIRIGQSFEVERVEEIVDDMVESIIRNPQALMWVAKLREQDITTYGHGLQVSVYLTSFGRHLGFPKAQLSHLAQVGLLLDIGKIKLPRELLEKQGRLSDEEFESAKAHVDHGLEILRDTPDFHADVIQGIAQHHERMNGSGYPQGLHGADISVFGRMAGIVDTFAALTNHRPYAAAVSSYEALRSLTNWSGEFFHEPLVQQFVSSIGVFPVGSLIELSTGEVAIVVAHNKVRRLKPRVLVVTGPDKTRSPHPAMLDLLYENKSGGDEPVYIKRGLPAGAYDLDLRDFYLS